MFNSDDAVSLTFRDSALRGVSCDVRLTDEHRLSISSSSSLFRDGVTSTFLKSPVLSSSLLLLSVPIVSLDSVSFFSPLNLAHSAMMTLSGTRRRPLLSHVQSSSGQRNDIEPLLSFFLSFFLPFIFQLNCF